MIYTKEILENYSQPISGTEEQQCKNAINMVKDSLSEYGYKINDYKLNKYNEDGYAYYYEFRDYSGNITAIVQGSYANNTNIKRYSDVDISIIYNPTIPLSVDSMFRGFKNKVYNALSDSFGVQAERHNKSITINGNNYRKNIDVVPAFSISSNIDDGIQFITDDGEKILNYPLKQIKNENTKNKQTNYKFKKFVRIFKNIKEDMVEANIKSAKDIGSFQLESLMWNVSNETYDRFYSLNLEIVEIINFLRRNKSYFPNYYESNGVKKLCPTLEAMNSISRFVDDLYAFYSYKE